MNLVRIVRSINQTKPGSTLGSITIIPREFEAHVQLSKNQQSIEWENHYLNYHQKRVYLAQVQAICTYSVLNLDIINSSRAFPLMNITFFPSLCLNGDFGSFYYPFNSTNIIADIRIIQIPFKFTNHETQNSAYRHSRFQLIQCILDPLYRCLQSGKRRGIGDSNAFIVPESISRNKCNLLVRDAVASCVPIKNKNSFKL